MAVIYSSCFPNMILKVRISEDKNLVPDSICNSGIVGTVNLSNSVGIQSCFCNVSIC